MIAKPLRKIFFITLPSVIIFVLALELCLRCAGYFYGLTVRSRSRESNAVSVSKTFNILCLGDSFTFGMGAGPEYSYPKQLARLLQSNISKDINVIDTGKGANTSSLILKGLEQDIDKYRPGIIIVMIGVNNNWNLQDSSYFYLNSGGSGAVEKLSELWRNLKVYKLVKIYRVNLASFIDKKIRRKECVLPVDRDNASKIRLDSMVFSGLGGKFFQEARYEEALDNFQKALAMDANNYYGYIGLAHIWNEQKDAELSKKAIRDAIFAIDNLNEWRQDNFTKLVNQIIVLNGMDSQGAEVEFKQLRQRLERNKGANAKLITVLDGQICMLKNRGLFNSVLEYDLRKIIGIARQNRVKVILQTYPKSIAFDEVTRKVSTELGVPLADNVMSFMEKTKDTPGAGFFVADGHCNEEGYRLIAENVYKVILDSGFLPGNLKQGEI